MTKKQKTCSICGHKLKEVNGQHVHKKKEHWLDKPHKPVPVNPEAL